MENQEIKTNPEFDWKIIFFSTLGFIILAVTLSIFIFIKIDKGEIFLAEPVDSSSSQTLDASRLRDTLEHYGDKADEFNRIINASHSSVDPSI